MLTGVIERAFPYPPAYRSQTGWGPWLAVLAALVIFVGSAVLGLGALTLVNGGAPIAGGAALSVELLAQLAIAWLTVFAAGRFGSRAADVLALRRPAGGWRDIGAGLVTIAIVSGIYTLAMMRIFPENVVSDLRPLWEIMHSPLGATLALVAVVGAPFSEEFLFRGFLQSALAKSGLGFAKAALITTAAWTALHASYSIVGMGEVFVVGLVLSWLLWRTGSLWVPIFCHAAYNGAVISFLAAFPVPA